MILFVLSAFIIAAISLFLIMHDDYEDGVFGRLALIIMALSNGLIVADFAIDQNQYSFLPNTLATQCGMALFLARHCFRFLRWRKRGIYEWKPKKHKRLARG